MTETKKRGRPPKPVAERRRHNQTFRCNDEMLARLQAEADRNQRSISEEVERRLERSFENTAAVDAPEVHYYNNIKRIMGGEDGFTEMVELGVIWKRVKDGYQMDYGSSPPWFENEDTYMRMEEKFKGSLRFILRGFAARSKREAHEREHPPEFGPAPKSQPND